MAVHGGGDDARLARILTALLGDEPIVADVTKLRELQDALEATDVMSDRDANACREIVAWVRKTFGHPRAKLEDDKEGGTDGS